MYTLFYVLLLIILFFRENEARYIQQENFGKSRLAAKALPTYNQEKLIKRQVIRKRENQKRQMFTGNENKYSNRGYRQFDYSKEKIPEAPEEMNYQDGKLLRKLTREAKYRNARNDDYDEYDELIDRLKEVLRETDYLASAWRRKRGQAKSRIKKKKKKKNSEEKSRFLDDLENLQWQSNNVEKNNNKKGNSNFKSSQVSYKDGNYKKKQVDFSKGRRNSLDKGDEDDSQDRKKRTDSSNEYDDIDCPPQIAGEVDNEDEYKEKLIKRLEENLQGYLTGMAKNTDDMPGNSRVRRFSDGQRIQKRAKASLTLEAKEAAMSRVLDPNLNVDGVLEPHVRRRREDTEISETSTALSKNNL